MMQDDKVRELSETLLDAIHKSEVTLPRLPELVRHMDQALSDDNKSIADIAKIVSADPVVSARLIQVANSPLMRGLTPVTTIKNAISRIGIKLTRNLIFCMVIKDQFTSTNKTYKMLLQECWEDSVTVAAYAFVIAQELKLSEPDVVMVAASIHNIGALPIINFLSSNDVNLTEEEIRSMIHNLHTQVGAGVLTIWEFPELYIQLIRDQNKYDAPLDLSTPISYLDVLIIAKTFAMFENTKLTINLNRLPSYRKAHLDVNQLARLLTAANKEVEELKAAIK